MAEVKLSNATVLATGSTTARSLAARAADVVNVKDYGAKGDGVTDDTAAITSAITALGSNGGVLRFPAGTFLVQPETFNGLKSGTVVVGAGQGRTSAKTVLRPAGVSHVIEVTGSYVNRIEIAHLRIQGAGPTSGSGNGIYFHDNGPYGGPSHLYFHDVTIEECGGRAIYMPQEWHTTLENVSVDNCGDNLIEIQGGNTTTLIRCYAHRVATGKSGYRIYEGAPTLVACNGIDGSSPPTTANWGTFGNSIASGDATDNYCYATLMGCNIEDFTDVGLLFKEGSVPAFLGNKFIAPASGTVTALSFRSAATPAYWGINNTIATKGASWSGGLPVHLVTGAAPPLFVVSTIVNGPNQYYSEASASAMTLPHISARYDGNFRSSIYASRLSSGPFYQARQSPTYGASITIDSDFSNFFVIGATDGNAFTIGKPLRPASQVTVAQELTFIVKNIRGDGGALGAVTWDPAYRLSGAWVNPADGYNRIIKFVYVGVDGSSNPICYEVSRSSADVPN